MGKGRHILKWKWDYDPGEFHPALALEMEKRRARKDAIKLFREMRQFEDYVDAEDLSIIFGYANVKNFNKAARRGNIPIETFKVKGRRFAHRLDVKEYFEEKKPVRC